MKRNTLCKRDYVLETVFWGIVAFIWYQNLFFINIPGKTVLESNLILIAMVAVSVTANLVFTIRWSRNTVSVITATLLPYGTYAYITYAKYMAKTYRIVLWAAVGICVLAALYIAVVKINARTKSRLVFRKVRMTYSAVRFVGAIQFFYCRKKSGKNSILMNAWMFFSVFAILKGIILGWIVGYTYMLPN